MFSLMHYVIKDREEMVSVVKNGLHNKEKLVPYGSILEEGKFLANLDVNLLDPTVLDLQEDGVAYALNVPNTAIVHLIEDGLASRYASSKPIGAIPLCSESTDNPRLLVFCPEQIDNHWDYITCYEDTYGRNEDSFSGSLVLDGKIRTLADDFSLKDMIKF